jgi:hypothetical protein
MPGARLDPLERSQYSEIFDYWLLFLAHWRWIVFLSVLAFAWVFVLTKFVLTKWYLSTAYIRPTPRQTEASELSSLASAALGGGQLGGLVSAAAGPSEAQSLAEEYISIMQGYAFTMDLLKGHHLVTLIQSESGGTPAQPLTPYRLYEAMSKRFDCKFDLDSGNVQMTFMAPSREESERILGFYIEDLQNRLRHREIQEASLAIASLKQQVEMTGDSLLQQDLYQLLAKQIQRQQLAQVQADLAFSVIDPPIAPDKPFKPRVLLSSAIAGMLMFIVSFGGIAVKQRLSEAWNEYQQRRKPETSAASVIALEELPPSSKKRSR